MYILKGFISIPAFHNNEPDNVAPLGEMSNQALSYSIEKGVYADPKHTNVKLTSFTSKDDGEDVPVHVNVTDHVLEVAQWMFSRSVVGEINDDVEEFRQLILGHFGTAIKDFESGKMEVHKGNWLPTYIAWTLDDGTFENELKIWFSDEAFRVQYDDYQIVVIPPLVPVDVFQNIKSVVEEQLSEFTIPRHHEAVLEATDGVPYTYLVSKDYDWYDREDPSATLETTWSVAIYGIAGNNPIIIKDSIAKHILANSGYNREQWIAVFPDIFTSTEFTFIPLWHRTSVPDETVRGSLYSPVIDYNEALSLATKYIVYPDETHVPRYMTLTNLHYKSLSLISVGGPENRGEKFQINNVFKDYAIIPATSIDFNRMANYTTRWIRTFIEAAIAAEELDEYSYIGSNLSRIVRDGRTYVGFDYDDILYLILSRMSMDEASPSTRDED